MIIKAVSAEYREQSLIEFMGNPLIEALPESMELNEMALRVSVRPPYDQTNRREPIRRRLEYTERLRHFHQPVEQDVIISSRIDNCIRWGYINRNPMQAKTTEVLSAIYGRTPDEEELKYLEAYHPNTPGFSIVGVSGVGKSTSVESALTMYPQIVDHTSYNGRPFILRQVVWLKIDCTHDGTLKGLCLDFFKEFDRIAGTDYQQHLTQRISTERMGYFSFDGTMKSLFGKTHHTDMFILLPYLASFVNDWTGSHPQLNADVITDDHTAFAYCNLAEWAWRTPTSQRDRLWNGISHYHTGFGSVKREQLYYCPECVAEEQKRYGEAYWHRLHQISHVWICEKHGTSLQPSGVSFESTKRGFFPAASVIRSYERQISNAVQDFKNKMQFVEDVKWILDNGNKIPSSGMIRKYLENKKNMFDEHGFLKASEIGLRDFEVFYKNRSGEQLRIRAYFREYPDDTYVSSWIFDAFKPTEIVLMMEYFEGSAEAFYGNL